MKTTLDIPDKIFRRAKSQAAEQGIPLRQFVVEAIEQKLREVPPSGKGPG
jgi:predicted HicB family RNase H-like nuclease